MVLNMSWPGIEFIVFPGPPRASSDDWWPHEGLTSLISHPSSESYTELICNLSSSAPPFICMRVCGGLCLCMYVGDKHACMWDVHLFVCGG